MYIVLVISPELFFNSTNRCLYHSHIIYLKVNRIFLKYKLRNANISKFKSK